jgi:NADH:ubiquinone oxidoreductase subunit H
MISYEVSIGLILPVIVTVGSLNLSDCISAKYVWFALPHCLVSFIFIACLAETNRAPSICLKLKLN